MEVKVQSEPWCETCPFVDLIVNKEPVYMDNELARVDLTAQCRKLELCRSAVKRAKALEEQVLAKWWEGMRVAPCGKEAQATVPPIREVESPSGKSGLERIREMGIDELIELVEADRGYICPPPLRGSKSCHREVTCETCWREWLWSSADGDPHD